MSDEAVVPYWRAFEDLACVDLEDSWVLAIEVTPSTLRFVLDVVLVPGHPQYRHPRPNEQHCYRSADLTFRSAHPIVFDPSGSAPATDARGEVDFGHIDSMGANAGTWELEGDWGSAKVQDPDLQLALEA